MRLTCRPPKPPLPHGRAPPAPPPGAASSVNGRCRRQPRPLRRDVREPREEAVAARGAGGSGVEQSGAAARGGGSGSAAPEVTLRGLAAAPTAAPATGTCPRGTWLPQPSGLGLGGGAGGCGEVAGQGLARSLSGSR